MDDHEVIVTLVFHAMADTPASAIARAMFYLSNPDRADLFPIRVTVVAKDK